jgi:hypothetical protein
MSKQALFVLGMIREVRMYRYMGASQSARHVVEFGLSFSAARLIAGDYRD